MKMQPTGRWMRHFWSNCEEGYKNFWYIFELQGNFCENSKNNNKKT